MEVVIDEAALVAHGSCGSYIVSPEWDSERHALVYTDWKVTAERLMSTPLGRNELDWLIQKELVPMTREEFRAKRAARKNGI